MVDGLTSGHNSNIAAIENLNGLAHLKVEVIVSIDIRHSCTTHTDIARLVVINKELDEFFGYASIRGQTDTHTWEGTQHGNVVKGVMGSTKCTVSHATRDTQNRDGVL